MRLSVVVSHPFLSTLRHPPPPKYPPPKKPQSLENAIAVVFALGGSTNAVLHLLAIAHECQLPLAVHDFNRIGERVPLLGTYVYTMGGGCRGSTDPMNASCFSLVDIPAPPLPHSGNLSPHGPYHMTDLDRLGGVPLVMKELLHAGLLHGDCRTVTGGL